MKCVLLAAAVVWACASPAHAQSLRERCATGEAVFDAYCRRSADAATSLPARLTLIAAGGNPTAGTASTLGMRLPGSPRVSAALRATGGRVTTPDPESAEGGSNRFSGLAFALDAAVGVFNGLNVAPTIGGFGSLDMLASAGVLRVPGTDGLKGKTGFTWAAGARVGVLRESFTAPGVSVSALYRSVPDVAWAQGIGSYEVTDVSAWTVRGTVGKRVLGVGVTGGVAWDRTRSDASALFTLQGPTEMVIPLARSGDTDSRLSYFANLSHTMTILNLVLELGWQDDGERANDAHRSTRRGGLFGGAAVRLAI